MIIYIRISSINRDFFQEYIDDYFQLRSKESGALPSKMLDLGLLKISLDGVFFPILALLS